MNCNCFENSTDRQHPQIKSDMAHFTEKLSNECTRGKGKTDPINDAVKENKDIIVYKNERTFHSGNIVPAFERTRSGKRCEQVDGEAEVRLFNCSES